MTAPLPAPEVYHDNWFDRAFIWLFSRKIANALRVQMPQGGYDGFVALSKQMMVGRNAEEQRAVVAVVLRSLVPPPVLWLIRTLFSPTRVVCELNAWFATLLFEWLVGPCEVRSVEVTQGDGTVTTQRSGVHIQKCRYLDQSRCVGLCVNLCKQPTERFFTEDFGIPLSMTPNFEDFSCEMVFGQEPAPLETEPVYTQPCLVNQCPVAQPEPTPCPQVRQ
ncbi:MAG: DUF4033 domain-containing protein [Prochlorothrix sp.]|nr:DUF4033 domain-containing protein [Prochlorothrix sp.]